MRAARGGAPARRRAGSACGRWAGRGRSRGLRAGRLGQPRRRRRGRPRPRPSRTRIRAQRSSLQEVQGEAHGAARGLHGEQRRPRARQLELPSQRVAPCDGQPLKTPPASTTGYGLVAEVELARHRRARPGPARGRPPRSARPPPRRPGRGPSARGPARAAIRCLGRPFSYTRGTSSAHRRDLQRLEDERHEPGRRARGRRRRARPRAATGGRASSRSPRRRAGTRSRRRAPCCRCGRRRRQIDPVPASTTIPDASGRPRDQRDGGVVDHARGLAVAEAAQDARG